MSRLAVLAIVARVAIAALGALGALAACGGSAPPVATALDASRANIALAELESGRTVLMQKCSRCHRTPLPAEHAASEWPRMVGDMAKRSNLDAEQRRVLEAYVVTMASR